MSIAIHPHADVLTQATLDLLIAPHTMLCLSLYMPSIRKGDQVRQNPIRFKNLVNAVEVELASRDLDQAARAALLSSLHMLEADTDFWAQPSDGLALFISPDFELRLLLPAVVPETVTAGAHFEILPLIPLLVYQLPFHLLTLDAGAIHLYHGDGYGLEELSLPGVPLSLEEYLRHTERERQLRFHSITTTSSVYHGQGSGGDETIRKDDLRAWFQRIDHAAADVVGRGDTPFILAGAAQNRGLFHEMTRRLPPVTGEIELHVAHLDLTALHAHAWRIVETQAQQAHKAALSHLRERAGSPRTMFGLEAILPAAQVGRVEALYAPQDGHAPGKIDAETGEVTLGEGENLLNLAAHETLRHGGRVLITAPGSATAATLRY